MTQTPGKHWVHLFFITCVHLFTFDISNFQNFLNHLCISMSFCFKGKIVEGGHKLKKVMCLKLQSPFSQNAHFEKLCHFFLPGTYPTNSFV